jgi:Flavodoxin
MVHVNIVIVYESMFGNTKAIGEGIAEGLREGAEVRFGSVDELSTADARDASLIVAGGPTHAHGMARRNAHQSVAKMDPHHKYGPVLPGRESLRGWLDRLPEGRTAAAAFDTRFDKPKWLTGSAAKKIARRLHAKGYPIIGTQSFFVETTGGPLADGERQRAVAWGRGLAAQVKPTIAIDRARSGKG